MTQIAVISSGGIVRPRTVKVAGEHFDGAIVRSLRSKRDLFVGDISAEVIKVQLGSAISRLNGESAEVSGRNEKLKCAQTILVSSEEVHSAVAAGYEAICRAITNVLESTPPEIAGDISEFGIMLVGGGANIRGIAELINLRTRLRVTVAQNPMDCECLGLGKLIERPAIIPGGILYKNR
jgi:rod shape-determining protein MreB